jgi:hypothetical protein
LFLISRLSVFFLPQYLGGIFESGERGVFMSFLKKMLLVGLVVCAVLAAPPKKKNSELPLAAVILDGKNV